MDQARRTTPEAPTSLGAPDAQARIAKAAQEIRTLVSVMEVQRRRRRVATVLVGVLVVLLLGVTAGVWRLWLARRPAAREHQVR